jgi:hypothetical protein
MPVTRRPSSPKLGKADHGGGAFRALLSARLVARETMSADYCRQEGQEIPLGGADTGMARTHGEAMGRVARCR